MNRNWNSGSVRGSCNITVRYHCSFYHWGKIFGVLGCDKRSPRSVSGTSASYPTSLWFLYVPRTVRRMGLARRRRSVNIWLKHVKTIPALDGPRLESRSRSKNFISGQNLVISSRFRREPRRSRDHWNSFLEIQPRFIFSIYLKRFWYYTMIVIGILYWLSVRELGE